MCVAEPMWSSVTANMRAIPSFASSLMCFSTSVTLLASRYVHSWKMVTGTSLLLCCGNLSLSIFSTRRRDTGWHTKQANCLKVNWFVCFVDLLNADVGEDHSKVASVRLQVYFNHKPDSDEWHLCLEAAVVALTRGVLQRVSSSTLSSQQQDELCWTISVHNSWLCNSECSHLDFSTTKQRGTKSMHFIVWIWPYYQVKKKHIHYFKHWYLIRHTLWGK